jgi:hypothetical protein
MANTLANIARVVSATTGTGTLTLGSAVTGFNTFANAGLTDGQTVTYAIEDYTGSDVTAREVGTGVFNTAGPTLTRATVYSSTSGGAKINCSGSQQVFITVSKEDLATYLTSATAASTYQPLDSDLTTLAANITAFGHSLVDDANAAAARTTLGLGTMATETATNYLTTAAAAAGYQPLDSDLTSIAALTTAAYGRSLLETTSEANFKATVNLEIGVDVQAYDAELAAIAGLTSAADRIPYFTGSGTAALATFTSAARSLLDDADADAMRTTLAIREKLTANRTYYVRTDGSDSNTGLVDSAGGAFLTIQKACDVFRTLDLGIYGVTIQVADGTYTAGASIDGANIGGSAAVIPLTIQGNTTTPANCVISVTGGNCFSVANNFKLYVTGFKLSTTTSGDCLIAARGGELRFGVIDFGACAAFHQEANDHGRIYNNGNYTISGSAVAHQHCNNLSYILTFSCTVTLSGTPAFSSYFVGISAAFVQYVSVTFSGSGTGKRYLVHQNGILWTNTSGETYLPGNSLGERATGGVHMGVPGPILPSIAGGTAASSTLTLKSTEGVGTTDAIIFQVGNNGAVEGARIGTAGRVGLGGKSGTVAPLYMPSDFATLGATNSALRIDNASNIIMTVGEIAANEGAVRIYNGGSEIIRLGAARASYFGAQSFGLGTSSPDRRLHSEVDDATTNAVTQVARFTHTTSGTPANGIGVGIEFEVETSASNNEVGATIEAVTTDVTATSEDFDLVFKNMAAGSAAAETARILSTGVFVAANEIRASGDTGGAASKNTMTNGSDLTANSTGVGTILFKGTTSRNSSGFIKFYIGTTAYYVPVFSAITG